MSLIIWVLRPSSVLRDVNLHAHVVAYFRTLSETTQPTIRSESYVSCDLDPSAIFVVNVENNVKLHMLQHYSFVDLEQNGR